METSHSLLYLILLLWKYLDNKFFLLFKIIFQSHFLT